MLLVGFQAQGTLGRILHDGASRVRIQGEDIQVRARIRSLDFYSGHADATGLVRWIAERGEFPAESFSSMAKRTRRPDSRHGWATPTSFSRASTRPMIWRAPPRAFSNGRQRMDPAQAGHPDWHNDASRLLLDINDALSRAADAKSRAVVLRRLRRALEDEKT